MSSSPAPAAAATVGATGSLVPLTGKRCFNTYCKRRTAESPPPRWRGWHLRSGELAELCDHCSAAYEQGSFCETFHSDADGWRKCGFCGKWVHCGCIVSVASFMLLDAGGIECISCAQKSFATQRLPYEFDGPNGTDIFTSARGFATSSQDKIEFDGLPERLTPQIHTQLGKFFNGNRTFGAPVAAHQLIREEGIDASENSPHLAGEAKNLATQKGPVSSLSINSDSGIGRDIPLVSTMNMPIVTYLKENQSAASLGLAAPLPLPGDKRESARFFSSRPHQHRHASLLAKDNFSNCHNSAESGGQPQSQVHNGRPRAEGRGRNQLLPRYWPRITDQELQQISRDSNFVITPLFEKMLSASDAGRIGRLVLPKKCAEAYFPSISQPEGLPIKFKMSRARNGFFISASGVTPCIQSMKLQAGDVVTFSRIDPGGKLVMGFRKTSNIPTDQDIQGNKSENGYSDGKEVNNKNGKASEGTSAPSISSLRNSSESATASIPFDQGTLSESGRSGIIQKEVTPSRYPMLSSKRKSSTLGTKSKRLRMENEDSIEVKLSWEEAQELLCPPPNYKPSVLIIEGHEIEEYEEAPVLGKPIIFPAIQDSEKTRWAQCGDCLKWRRVPACVLLPLIWTCSDNSWVLKGKLRLLASCSSAQQISSQQLEDLLHRDHAASEPAAIRRRRWRGKWVAPAASGHSVRHPRHRRDCTRIQCIQPHSGRGPKHRPASSAASAAPPGDASRRSRRVRRTERPSGRRPPRRSPPSRRST
ncbi:unnamed protein product [Spirodela intermedia]|uniref:CW-type domain-containing protein n=1 Tax=Spirodela intermedia TaxID=51605 RepID=A0A7I8JPF6_SPIIN|nr:unnamed protein product [Spirodela intermedia]CAA6672036.1 unnamed protein product [Spirodela intermedia]